MTFRSKKARLKKSGGTITIYPTIEFMASTLADGEYTLTIDKEEVKRTLSQNSLMWMWFECIHEETGTSRQAVHDHYCDKFLKREIVFNGETEYVKCGTSSLNTIQMTNFLNEVQADAASEFGINLPLPEDKYYQEFIDYYSKR